MEPAHLSWDGPENTSLIMTPRSGYVSNLEEPYHHSLPWTGTAVTSAVTGLGKLNMMEVTGSGVEGAKWLLLATEGKGVWLLEWVTYQSSNPAA